MGVHHSRPLGAAQTLRLRYACLVLIRNLALIALVLAMHTACGGTSPPASRSNGEESNLHSSEADVSDVAGESSKQCSDLLDNIIQLQSEELQLELGEAVEDGVVASDQKKAREQLADDGFFSHCKNWNSIIVRCGLAAKDSAQLNACMDDSQ
jgi:hypothetical protein